LSCGPLWQKKRAKSVPPKSNRFVADIDATLMQKILHVPKRKRKSNIHHHGQTDIRPLCRMSLPAQTRPSPPDQNAAAQLVIAAIRATRPDQVLTRVVQEQCSTFAAIDDS
jgi:hypothetical protein